MVGYLSAACASLITEALSEPNEENLRRLIEKHHLQDIPVDIPCPCDTQQVYVDSDLVLKKLRSFPKGSAPGPSGTRASHLLHAIQINNQTPALDVLTDFVNHLSAGLVPLEVQPFLADLIGLSKKDGAIRPIAIGDVYRRLTGNAFFLLF